MDDEAFVRASEIFVLAPLATEVDINDIFRGRRDNNNDAEAIPVLSIAQRSLLYFGTLYA